MKNIWQESFTVRSGEVDFQDHLKLNSLFHHMQEAAALHATHMQVGFSQLAEKGLYWVLSRVRLEMDYFPSHGETIHLTTWPKRAHKLFSLRDFLFTGEGDTPYGRATTAWVLVSIKKKRPTRLTDLDVEIPYLSEKEGIVAVPEKMPPPKSTIYRHSQVVRYSDIDLHRHVNNARYVEMVSDCFSPDDYERLQVRSLELHFLSECHVGDSIEIHQGKNSSEDASYYFEGKREEDRVFQALLEWGQREE